MSSLESGHDLSLIPPTRSRRTAVRYWMYDRPGSWGGVWTRHHGAGVRVPVKAGGKASGGDKGKIVSSGTFSPTN